MFRSLRYRLLSWLLLFTVLGALIASFAGKLFTNVNPSGFHNQSLLYALTAGLLCLVVILGIVLTKYGISHVEKVTGKMLDSGEAQRDKALQEASESLKKYRELAEMLPQSIFETNSWGNYTYVNKAWYNNFGYSEKDLNEGLNLIETLLSGNDDILGINKIENSLFTAIRKDGTRFPASVYTDNITINGVIKGRRGIIIDISDSIAFIQNLQKETRKAKSADQLKSSFLANMSHEIRTPLNSIVGFSNLLAVEQIPDAQKKDFVAYIRSSSEVLLNLVDDIIDIAKIEAGELKINRKECEIKPVCEELLKTFGEFRMKLDKSHLDLVFKPDNEVPDLMLKTDPFRLRQVLANLLSNAIKFTEHGLVEFGYKVREEKTVEFFVRDTGSGLTREELDLIFERFKRSNMPEKQNIAGTGLGLAISRNLVQLLGGEMWVDSEPARGSVFFFTLPYLRTSSVPLRQTYKDYSEDNYDWKGKSILIAEDDQVSFDFLKQLLLNTGASVSHVCTGLEAVEFCRSRDRVDLVVMDIRMPEMNGMEATKRIKNMYPDLPVIAQTAYAMEGDMEKIRLSGCDDYLSKPVDIVKFLSVLNFWLKRKNEKPEPETKRNSFTTQVGRYT